MLFTRDKKSSSSAFRSQAYKYYRPSLRARPAADNLQHPGHDLHRRKRPEATLPGSALRPLLQRPQSPQHGRWGPRQRQGERQCAAGGRCAGDPERRTHHHLGAAGDVHHLYWDHHHALHYDHAQTAFTTHHSGKAGNMCASVCMCAVSDVSYNSKMVLCVFQSGQPIVAKRFHDKDIITISKENLEE